MDPILFRQQLKPLEKHDYNIEEILKICYPLRGLWDWNMIEDASKSVKRIFKMVHLSEKYLMIEPDWITETYMPERIDGLEYDERWGICWEKNKDVKSSYLYESLGDLLKEDEEEKSISLSWDDTSSSSSEEVTVSISESLVKEIVFSVIERDQKWKDCNPAFNPRLIEDLESGYLNPPDSFTKEQTIDIINKIHVLANNEFLAADGSGDVSNDGIQEFGIFGKAHCMKSVKLIRFFRETQKSYNLDINVSEWVEKAEKRKSIWAWLRVGNGFYRNFDWMFLGDRDCIIKTINVLKGMGYKPLKMKPGKFDFDPSPIWKLSSGKCLDIDTGKVVPSSKKSDYGWISKDMSEKRVLQVRGYIFEHFKKKYPERLIPGRKNKWAREFKEKVLNRKKYYIDFSTLNPIKYSAYTSCTHEFSKLGFALSKDEVNFNIKDLENFIKNK